MNDAAGEGQALRLLVEALYSDLKRVARRHRGQLAGGETLRTTAIVNEAYLKLARGGHWQSREHFMNSAARAMRQVLVDYARARLSAKRGSGQTPLDLDEEIAVLAGETPERVLALNEAMERLKQVDERLVRVVECRYFAGYSEQETAQLMGLSERTVRSDWVKAKAWLFREISS